MKTVGELMAELAQWPQETEIEVAGYAAGDDSKDAVYEVTALDGWRDENGNQGVTIWARLMPDAGEK